MPSVRFSLVSLILLLVLISHSTAIAEPLLRIENNQLFVNSSDPVDITLTAVSWGPHESGGGAGRIHIHSSTSFSSHKSCPIAFGNWQAGRTARFPYFQPNQEIIFDLEILTLPLWFTSGPADRNEDNKVHVKYEVVAGTPDTIRVGFEHTLYGGEHNFTDTVFTVTATPAPKAGTIDPNRHFMGMNLGPYNYYSTNRMFLNLLKSAHPFLTQNNTTVSGGTNPWNTFVMDQIPTDENGYPLELPYDVPGTEAPQVAASLLFRVDGRYPAGIYTFLYDGTGVIHFKFDVKIIHQEKGKILLDATPTGAGIFFSIKESQKGDHIRNIRIIPPGFEAADLANVFHPTIIERLKNFNTIRFMEMRRINNSKESLWENRTLPNFYAQGDNSGVALEHLIDLTNKTFANPWFSVPHLADDTYIREMALLIKNRLNPYKKVYIEYSNELWNSMFSQAKYIERKGCEIFPENDCFDGANDRSDAYWAGVSYHAMRSAEIFHIFEEVFGGSDRLVKVLGGASVISYRQEILLEKFNDPRINPHNIKADAVAIAPYFAEFANDIAQNNEVETITIDEILNRAEKSISKSVFRITNNKKITDKYGLSLIAYEGGQHLVATGSYKNNTLLTQKLTEANRHPRMKDLNEKMFKAWYAYGGDLFCYFRLYSFFSKHGSWGVFEGFEQPAETSPKFQAILPYISNPNQKPLASVGENLIIESHMQPDTVLTGQASDPDGDPIYYQWLKGDTPLSDFLQVNADGSVGLALSTLNPLALGDHTFTLVVKDDLSETRDEIILTIGNSKPNAVPVGAGTYEILTPITLKGAVSDYDGDTLSYEWYEILETQKVSFYTGNITTPFGGEVVSLADMVIPLDLMLGDHTIYLSVSDGITEVLKKAILIKVVDNTAPTLAPAPNTSLIWPPNHKMVDIIIQANAEDNSGSLTLKATVHTNDPSAEPGVDYTTPEIFQGTGDIHLKVRAERPGKGDGRTYTIVVTATDISGNSSIAKVDIVCPHDKKRK